MSAIGNNTGSLRLERLDTSRLAWAFALSVAVHLLLWGGYTGGQKVGLWEKLHLPAWVQKLMHALSKPAKPENKPLFQESEPPLMFVNVNPTVATAEPPKDAKYYSSANSQAANPNADRDTNIPKITGRQEQVPKTEDAERNKFSKLQPALPADQPQTEERARSKPKIASGDLTLAKPEEHPLTDLGEAPKPRPRRLSEVAQNKISRPPGQKMKQDGGVKRRLVNDSALDVKATPFGAYDTLLVNAISQRWYDLLDSREYASEARGHVEIQFKLNSDGTVTEIKVAETTVSETLSLLCYRAIHDPAPFEKWPDELRKMVGESYRKIQFTFYYN